MGGAARADGGGARPPDATMLPADWGEAAWGLPEPLWREIYYSYAGNFTRTVLEPSAPWWVVARGHDYGFADGGRRGNGRLF